MQWDLLSSVWVGERGIHMNGRAPTPLLKVARQLSTANLNLHVDIE